MIKIYFLILLQVMFFNVLYAQEKSITGKVTDSNAEALLGVNVSVVGSNLRTVTNKDGNFAIKVPIGNNILEFSYLGFEKHRIDISEKSVVHVEMIESSIGLKEVVAVGYGSQTKENLTGAVTSVKLDDVDSRSFTNADQMLQGKVAGLSIVQNSGQPGDDASTIRIRGVSSIDNNNDPLVIIDGVAGSFNDVNPNDIKSISVLKDAASAAIYGSRASAGVIIIETKTADKEISFDYSGKYSSQHVTRLPKTVNSWEYAALRNEARQNVGTGIMYTDQNVELFKYGISGSYPNTDWYDEYFDSGLMQNHYLTARGGNTNYKFSSSLGYIDQKGVLLGTNSKNVSFRSRVDANYLNNKVRFNFNVYGFNKKSNELSDPSGTVMSQIALTSPTVFIQAEGTDGNPGLYSHSGKYIGMRELGGGINYEDKYINTQGYIEIEPVKKLVGKVLLSKSRAERDYGRLMPDFEYSHNFLELSTAFLESALYKTFSQTDNNQLTATLKYDTEFAKHKLSAIVGYERLERKSTWDQGFVKNLSSNQPIFNYGDPTSPFLESTASESATASQFGRVNYSIDNKYLFEMNLRRDGASRFAENNQWGWFPAISAGWRISEEKLLKKYGFMNLKLRGSWGRLGNQNIGTYYASSDQMSGSEYYAFGNSIVAGRGTTVLANPNTTWETTEQINIGLDATLWRRLDITIDYFNKHTYDILARVTIPPSLGVTTIPYQNIGDMVNKGIEISGGYRSMKKKDKLNFSINANISFLSNKVTSLGDVEFVDHSTEIRSVIGHPFASYYGYEFDRILQIGDFTWENNSDESIPHNERNYILKTDFPSQSIIMGNPAPGDLKIRDLNDDGIIDPQDKTIIGRSIPKINYGISVSLSYKNFDMNLIGQGIGGIQSYINGPFFSPFFNAGAAGILTEMAENRWTYENQSTTNRRIYEDKQRDEIYSSYNLFKSSFFRLKSAQLGYVVPTKITDRWKISRIKVFFTGENLLLLSNFIKGYDPERDFRSTRANLHPQIASYSLGINLGL